MGIVARRCLCSSLLQQPTASAYLQSSSRTDGCLAVGGQQRCSPHWQKNDAGKIAKVSAQSQCGLVPGCARELPAATGCGRKPAQRQNAAVSSSGLCGLTVAHGSRASGPPPQPLFHRRCHLLARTRNPTTEPHVPATSCYFSFCWYNLALPLPWIAVASYNARSQVLLYYPASGSKEKLQGRGWSMASMQRGEHTRE